MYKQRLQKVAGLITEDQYDEDSDDEINEDWQPFYNAVQDRLYKLMPEEGESYFVTEDISMVTLSNTNRSLVDRKGVVKEYVDYCMDWYGDDYGSFVETFEDLEGANLLNPRKLVKATIIGKGSEYWEDLKQDSPAGHPDAKHMAQLLVAEGAALDVYLKVNKVSGIPLTSFSQNENRI